MFFFIVSQVLGFLITPLTWMVALILIAAIWRNKKWSRRCLIGAAIVSVFFTNQFIALEAYRLWEFPITEDAKLDSCYDVGIVLGGGMVTEDAQNHRLTFRNNTDRILQAVGLYKTGKIKKMLLSSGSGSLKYRDMLECALLRKYLLRIGIPDSVMLVDSLSDNTYQNAVNTAGLLKKEFPDKPGKYLLITSGSHMPRALACFKKAGISVTPYSTSIVCGKRDYSISDFLIPSMEALRTWNFLTHEWLGYITYWIFGYL
jgi:uncharacterized SAM-binding protein YcdF (DUF218 family)